MTSRENRRQVPDSVIRQGEGELVEAARRGDIDSFGELCKRHYASVVGLAYCILCDRDLAEDAAQEALAIACRDLRGLRNPGKFGGWLRGIARNVAKNSMAKRQRESALRGDISDRPNDRFSGNGSMETVRKSVRELPNSYREVVVLRYFSGLSYEEIAATLNISARAVNGRLTRAKRKLAERLRCNGFGKDRA
jgi:RNA polymerase sigma-70 factor (ECF subfamily)